MNQYKKLAGNSVIFAIGNFGSRVISFVMLPLYTYKLTTAEYGTVDLLLTLVSLLLPVVTLSIFDAVLRFAMEKETNPKKLYTNSMHVTQISSLILLVLSLILFVIKSNVAFLPLLLALQSYQSLFSQYAKGIGKVKIFAINGILLSFLTAALNLIFLIPFNMGLTGYLMSTALSFLFSDIFLYYILNLKKEKDNSLLDKDYRNELLKFSSPLIPNSVAWWVTTAIGRFFILFFIGVESNGLYAVANKIPALLTVFTTIFAQSWQISAIEEFNSENRESFFSNIYTAYSEALVIGCSFILVVLNPLFKILVAPEFYVAWQYAPILLLSVVFSSLSGFLGSQYIAAKETVSVLKTTLLGAFLNIVLNLLLVPIFGINGVGMGSALSFFIVWLIREKDLQRFLRFQMPKKLFLLSIVVLICQYECLLLMSGFLKYVVETILFLLVLYLNRFAVIGVLRKIKTNKK